MNNAFNLTSKSAKHLVHLSRQQHHEHESTSESAAEEDIPNQIHDHLKGTSTSPFPQDSSKHDEQEETLAYMRFYKLNKYVFIEKWMKGVHPPHLHAFSVTGHDHDHESLRGNLIDDTLADSIHNGSDANINSMFTTSDLMNVGARVFSSEQASTTVIVPLIVHLNSQDVQESPTNSASELSCTWAPSPLLFQSTRRMAPRSQRKRLAYTDRHSVECGVSVSSCVIGKNASLCKFILHFFLRMMTEHPGSQNTNE